MAISLARYGMTGDITDGGYRYAPSRRSRAGSALAALAIVALIALVLWRMGLLDQGPSGAGAHLTSVSLQSGTDRAASPHAASKAAAKAARPHQTAPVTTPRSTPTTTIKPPPRLSDKPAPAFIAMSGADMAAGDISRMSHGAAGGGAGSSHGSSYGPGEGPGGMSLVNVDWYRRPTDAEMSPYMPRAIPPGSWATIACRMIDHYQVEDCQELDESPPGSHLSRALRLASWQFKVRPPSVDGKPKLGTWVRIRFTWDNHGE